MSDTSNPSFKLKASVQTYELSMENLKDLFSKELGVPASRISITIRERVVSSDPMDRFPDVYGFDGLTVTVKSEH